MNENDLTVLDLLKTCLHPPADGILPGLADCDWRAVFEEMKQQAVEALPQYWIRQHPVTPQPLLDEWTKRCAVQQATSIRVMNGQDRLVRLLDAHGIGSVIIKGAAAAMAYPEPSLRVSGDVDILVSRENFDEAARIMEENGFRLLHEKSDSQHHIEYRKDKITFELHRRLSIVQSEDEARIALFEDGIAAREYRRIGGFAFPVLPVRLNGLVLLCHINQHLRSGLGLRQIIDWMMYLEENGGMEPLRPLARDLGLERLADTVTAMCRRYLGLTLTVADSDDYPCDELLAFILEKGNFGRKAGQEGKAAFAAMDAQTPGRLFRRLQAGGMSRWKAAQKHRSLRCFAWLYQSGHVLRELASGGVGPRKLMRLRRKGVGQRELLERLGLDVERDIQLRDPEE